MQIDFSASELFFAYLAGRASLDQFLDHPAYRTVCRHARLFGDGITPQDVEAAVHGRPSPFYGLEHLAEREGGIRSLLASIRRNEQTWLALAGAELACLFPAENLAITIYPIIGYDMGIGLNDTQCGAVCMNCNVKQYLAEPQEFLFYMIHECVHVIYERQHDIPALAEVTTPRQWRSYFNLWLQNEGYAVYAPLRLRQEMGYMDERDYRVLADPAQIEAYRLALVKALAALRRDEPSPDSDYIELSFGPRRLTYRMGCEIIRRVEAVHGSEAVRQAFYWDGDRFAETHLQLLDGVQARGTA